MVIEARTYTENDIKNKAPFDQIVSFDVKPCARPGKEFSDAGLPTPTEVYTNPAIQKVLRSETIGMLETALDASEPPAPVLDIELQLRAVTENAKDPADLQTLHEIASIYEKERAFNFPDSLRHLMVQTSHEETIGKQVNNRVRYTEVPINGNGVSVLSLQDSSEKPAAETDEVVEARQFLKILTDLGDPQKRYHLLELERARAVELMRGHYEEDSEITKAVDRLFNTRKMKPSQLALNILHVRESEKESEKREYAKKFFANGASGTI